jgi:hypothetical protein
MTRDVIPTEAGGPIGVSSSVDVIESEKREFFFSATGTLQSIDSAIMRERPNAVLQIPVFK